MRLNWGSDWLSSDCHFNSRSSISTPEAPLPLWGRCCRFQRWPAAEAIWPLSFRVPSPVRSCRRWWVGRDLLPANGWWSVLPVWRIYARRRPCLRGRWWRLDLWFLLRPTPPCRTSFCYRWVALFHRAGGFWSAPDSEHCENLWSGTLLYLFTPDRTAPNDSESIPSSTVPYACFNLIHLCGTWLIILQLTHLQTC